MPKGATKLNSGRVPVLRFPEFSEEWEEKKLGEIATFQKGRNISKEDISRDGNLECIRYGELYTYYKEVIHSVKSRTNLKSEDLVLSESNDVIIPASGETQWDIATVACVLINGVALGGDINIIRSKEDGAFLAYYLGNARRRNIARLSQGNSVVHLYSSQLKSLKLLLPSAEEQQKIAGFLGVVDEKIDVLSKKKASLERYKKGVMQKIFSQEIRFKDESGNSYPDWEEKRLGEIGEIIGGGTPDTANTSLWNGKINWFTPTEIKQKYVSTSARNISAEGLRSSSAKLLPVGTLLLTTRATIGDISILKCEATTNQGFQSIVVNKENSNDFVYYWILKNKKEFLRRANGSTFAEISGKEVKKIKGTFPSLPEQQKIADFLTSLDEKISVIGNELSRAKEFKKGLLHQMFV